MDTFENVSVVKKANVYFEGKVTSRTLVFADGSKKTLGVMLPGTYTFNTQAAEVMEILAGNCEVHLGKNTLHVRAGESFDVPALSTFEITCPEVVDYCCSFVE
ncbi:pyrimidine/purine nucleoside phosphorylase [Sulfurospirillum sp. T05]|uniref:Pyrimidine/purine nucleoside phosphorylase n=1 Tax=Sulfurospirillum tamanense TaxID=2813362 RepID=A0ABS2WSI0_9BACT|nr:pyrimidine/purine nucleoside phosphorylase [Sulfurospirillum tamanensis]MBN2964558.1 pyrimidine/purine nucleoside phosphorylase [Sulfurospirillum tamanensis]